MVIDWPWRKSKPAADNLCIKTIGRPALAGPRHFPAGPALDKAAVETGLDKMAIGAGLDKMAIAASLEENGGRLFLGPLLIILV